MCEEDAEPSEDWSEWRLVKPTAAPDSRAAAIKGKREKCEDCDWDLEVACTCTWGSCARLVLWMAQLGPEKAWLADAME